MPVSIYSGQEKFIEEIVRKENIINEYSCGRTGSYDLIMKNKVKNEFTCENGIHKNRVIS